MSNEYEGGPLVDNLGYAGKKVELCEKAMVSDRMLRLYNHKTPTKQTLIAVSIAVNKEVDEIDRPLHKYGYCLSESMITDIVIKWYLSNRKIYGSSRQVLDEINETLDKMGLPLLMTRIS